MKIAKIWRIPLKEKNSPDTQFSRSVSNSFSFLTLHSPNFLTHFPEGGWGGLPNYEVYIVKGAFLGLFLSSPESKRNLREKEKFRRIEEITPLNLGFVKMEGEDKKEP